MASSEHIISACSGYTKAQLTVFLSSLDAVGFKGTLHAIVDCGQDPIYEDERSFGYQVNLHPVTRPGSVHVNRVFRLLQMLPLWQTSNRRTVRSWRQGLKGISKTILEKSLPISSLRYVLALAISEQAPADSRILLTDSRDVLFQTNPFSALAPDEEQLVLSLESRAIEPGNITYKWLLDVYGKATVDPWIGKPISCSGTSMGSRNRIIEYLELMNLEILRHRNRISHTIGYDQGIHNYLLYSGALPEHSAPPNGMNPFFVAQVTPRFDEAGLVCAEDGSVFPVVHQFDRKPSDFSQSKWLNQFVIDDK